MGRDWKNFEMHGRKSLDFLEETTSRNTNFKAILVRAQKEVKSMIGKVSVISENASLIMNRMLANMNDKGIFVEGSEK